MQCPFKGRTGVELWRWVLSVVHFAGRQVNCVLTFTNLRLFVANWKNKIGGPVLWSELS